MEHQSSNKLTGQEVYDEIVDRMKTVYQLEPSDYDMDLEKANEIAESGETPEEWCKWYAEKYDLIKLSEWTPEKATRFMNRFKKQ